MARRTGVPPSTRTSLGAPPTLIGVSEARMQNPGAKTRRGNEEDWLFDIVIWTDARARPHPEERACGMVPPTRMRVDALSRCSSAWGQWRACILARRSQQQDARAWSERRTNLRV